MIRREHEVSGYVNPFAQVFVIPCERACSIFRGKHVLNSSDADLVKRAQGGEVNAVGELYDRHHESIFRYVRSRVGDQGLAEDLTGEIFTRMLAALPDYRLRGTPFRAWLYRIAHNLVVDHYRKESGRSSVSLGYIENAGEEGSDPASIIEHKLTLEQVYQARKGLPRAQAPKVSAPPKSAVDEGLEAQLGRLMIQLGRESTERVLRDVRKYLT